MNKYANVHVSPATAQAVRRGHPWVFLEQPRTMVAGQPVQLVDPRERPVAWGLADEGRIAVRVLGLGLGPRHDWRLVVAERIRRADQSRLRLLPASTNAYRILNGAGDGTPGLVVDRYGGLGVIRVYSKCWVPHTEWLVQQLKQLPWLDTLYQRYGVRSVDGRDGGQTWIGGEVPDRLVIEEMGVKMLVRPRVGQKTGLFLDQRRHRSIVREIAAGRMVANLFSYTGGFSVYAALGGAARVHTVDIAGPAVEDARENFKLNGLDPDDHAFEVADAFEWECSSPLDMMVIDPPSLARQEAAAGQAVNAYRKLHRVHGKKLGREGVLATSSCTARVALEEWKGAVAHGLESGQWSWMWQSQGPFDHPVAVGHPEGHYLKFALLRRFA